jgi:CRISPR-associated endonuclease/helicase Cas3
MLTVTLPLSLRRRLLSTSDDELKALRAHLFLIALHDFGKATPAFQTKVEWAQRLLVDQGFDFCQLPNARFHGDVGVPLLVDQLVAFGVSRRVAARLARTVCAHHGQFPMDGDGVADPSKAEAGAAEPWQLARTRIFIDLVALFGVEPGTFKRPSHSDTMLVAGLTSVADWVGSMDTIFTYVPPQPSLSAYWPIALERADAALDAAGLRAPQVAVPSTFNDLFPDFDAWPLHVEADRLSETLDEPALVIVEAPMGEGKTEAALLLAENTAARAGQNGLYIGLPTKATANQMFGRVERFLERTRPGIDTTLLLTHGDASLNERFDRLRLRAIYDNPGKKPDSVTSRRVDEIGHLRAEAWFLSKKRALLGEFAVGTIDQTLLSVMRVPHLFVRLFGLAGKTVILDEVHAYDTYTGTLLDRLVEWLAAVGSTVVLLSATLPKKRRAQLVEVYQRGCGSSAPAPEHAPYPRVTVTRASGATSTTFAPRSSGLEVKVERVSDRIADIAPLVVTEALRGGCIGWVCNSVRRAQEAAEYVRTHAPEITRLVLHARMLPDDRLGRERMLESWLGPEGEGVSRPSQCIVIGTQVLEQSLDVDFDLLVTDIAPVDLVLQRMGRVWRHARSNRHDARKADGARVLLSQPASLTSKTIDELAFVYERVVVKRTLEVLEGRPSIHLPSDIEKLVGEVYDELATLSDAELLKDLVQWQGAAIADKQQAQQRLIPHVTDQDDIFGDLQTYFTEDDDPAIHHALRAVTRLGPPSVDVVCVERRDGKLFVGDGGDDELDLDAEPSMALVKRLVRRSVGLSDPRIVKALKDSAETQPRGWRASALLRYRRIVGFEAKCAVVAGLRLQLDDELGLITSAMEHA